MKLWNLWRKIFVVIVGNVCFLTFAFAEPIQDRADALSTPHDPEILIFISFSMPIESIAQWSRQANRIQAPLIIRGLVNNSFGETQKKVAEFSGKEQGGVVLDPRLFTAYGITQVPAVVVRQPSRPCPPTQSCGQDSRFDVVAGDVGLDSALQAIADRGEEGAPLAQKALAQLRRYE